MKTTLLTSLPLAGLAILVLAASQRPSPNLADPIERGRYLVTLGGCADCHTRGIWTEAMFIEAMRTGRHMSVGREILPPMPWRNLAALTDDDLKAIFAYLRSVPPVSNHVPAPLPPEGSHGYE